LSRPLLRPRRSIIRRRAVALETHEKLAGGLADVADRGLGRLNWADSGLKPKSPATSGPGREAVLPIGGATVVTHPKTSERDRLNDVIQS
jgi:hypothetical protein